MNYTPLSHQKDYGTVQAGKKNKYEEDESAILG